MDFRWRAVFTFASSLAFAACADDTPNPSDTDGDTSTGNGPSVTTTATTTPVTETQGMTGVVMDTTDGDTTVAIDDSTTTDPTLPPTTATDSSTTDGETTDATTTTGPPNTTDPPGDCWLADLGSAIGNGVASGSTVGQGDDWTPSCVFAGSPDVMYLWTAPSDGSWLITTFGSSYDTALSIRPGCDGFAELACNDDSQGLLSSLVVPVDAGESIIIVVDGYGGEAGNYQLNISESIPGDCCQFSAAPGCNDPACEAAVCAIEPWCCDQQWDDWCAFGLAPQYCEQCYPLGPCCLQNLSPSCEDAACANQVCAIDPSCCEVQWTASCANAALSMCDACAPGVGDCCVGNFTPGCESAQCEAIICNTFDSWCCDVEWDEWCADQAEQVCPVCMPPGPCCYANFSPGCVDPFVQDCVCSTMPQCCGIGTWTPACAAAVTANGCGSCSPPQNACVDADLGSATGQVASGTNVGQGNDLALPCAAPGGADVAFTWTSPADGNYTFSTAGTNYDVAIGLIHPDCVGEVIDCSGSFMQFTEQVTRWVPAGVTVVVAIDGFGATLGNYVLNIN